MSDINASVVVTMPMRIFTQSRAFKAISNGRIYIGVPDTDPTIPANQIPVYVEREDGVRIPSQQPININAGGFPVYNGQVVTFVTLQAHSMAVYNSYGAQEHYFPNVLKFDPAEIEYRLSLPTGAGMVGTAGGGTVQDAIDDMVSKTALRSNIVFATADAGIANDGVTDVSDEVSKFLNENKGKFIVFDSGVYLFAGVELTGSGWEGTTIVFKGKHLLSVRPGDVGNSPFGAWCGLVISQDVSGLTLHYRGDGNRSKQYDEEHIFNVAITGADNITIPYFEANEIRGDGLYVSRGNPVSNGTKLPTNLTIGTIKGINSEKDGRNLISIVALLRGHIDYVQSENIGGIVGGVLQPGGLDIEPNPGENFIVRDVTVVDANIINAGSSGASMFVATTTSPRQIQNCHILKATLRTSGIVRLEGAQDSSIVMTGHNLPGPAMSMEGTVRCSISGVVDGCDSAALVGIRAQVAQCAINANASNARNVGVTTGWAENCCFDLTVGNFQTNGEGNLVGLWFRDINKVGGFIQRNNNYKVNISSDAARAIDYFTSSEIAFLGENVLITGTKLAGFTSFTSVTGNAGRYLRKSDDIPGLTLSNLMPATGTWRIGDIVRNSQPTSSALVFGWVRLTTGSGNTLGSDWGVLKFSIN